MLDLKWVRLETPGPVGVGTRASRPSSGSSGIGVPDPVEVIEFLPPHRLRDSPRGHVPGDRRLPASRRSTTAEPGSPGTRRSSRRSCPSLLGLILAPILGRVFQADLERPGRAARDRNGHGRTARWSSTSSTRRTSCSGPISRHGRRSLAMAAGRCRAWPASSSSSSTCSATRVRPMSAVPRTE